MTENDDIQTEFIRQVEETLDYDLGRHLDINKDKNLFEAFLIEKDIRPFTQDSVDKYKAFVIKSLNPNWYVRWCSEIPDRASFFGSVGCAIALAAIIMSLCFNWYAVPVCFLSAIVFSMSAFTLYQGIRSHNIDYYQWHRQPLHDYTGIVPDFALQTALDIKRKFKGVRFYVEFVGHSIPDPFLVCYNNKNYYLEVWNEPKFKQERIA
jgi:hypothetical protein